MAIFSVSFAVVAAIVFLFCKFLQHLQARRKISRIHGPRSYPIIGNLLQLKWSPSDVFEQQAGVAHMFTNPHIFLIWLGPVPVLYVNGANEAEAILSSNKHINKADQYKFLHPWMGLGLLTSYAEKWRPRRKLLTPTFHYDILNDFVGVFNSQCRILVKKMQETVGQGPVDYYQHVNLCALDIICETAMGRHVNAQQDINSDYVTAVYLINDIIHHRQKSPWLWNDFIFNKFGRGKQHEWCLQLLHGFTENVIKEHYAVRLQKKSAQNNDSSEPEKATLKSDDEASENKEKTSKKRLAFLDLLLEMVDQGKLTLDDVRQEVDTFMFEGHDTTTAGMNWTLFLLGNHPEIQAKVHQELDSIFAEDSSRDITSEDLKKMEYLERCVKESLRIYPSVPIYARKLEDGMEVAGHSLPAGMTVVVNAHAIHRDERHWPDPEIFDPDRFSPDNSANRHPYAYVPFSAGARNCIGQRFALMEEKSLIAWVMRFYRIKSCQRRDHVRPKEELILRPSEPSPLILELRNIPNF